MTERDGDHSPLLTADDWDFVRRTTQRMAWECADPLHQTKRRRPSRTLIWTWSREAESAAWVARVKPAVRSDR